MDYFMLGVFELHVNKAHHNTIASLVVTIKELKGNLDKDTVAKACRCFRTRIEAVVEANRDFLKIEWYIMPITFIFFYFNEI
jgi:hypothetical protein